MPKTINEMSEEQILNYQTKQQLEEIANSPLKKVVKSKVDTNLDFKKIQVAKIKAETEEKSQFEFSERNHYDEEYTKLGKKIAKERVMKKFYVPPKQPIIFDPLKYRETFVLEKADLNQQKNNQKQQNEYKNSNLNEMADAIKERREQKLKKDIENCELQALNWQKQDFIIYKSKLSQKP
ncbi:hypothetical protein PPERSA_04362 [Pseudocohnilembus persalinus]|uniref:Uncharacterized protein n=1 Tax=Pseudocohnilembus persalinus TaxID=266149 RepID=A0A0V0QQJ1_PSEPJ|nr:hypothetical protein PPERSA_04362 [Pseudocohnilembus persalinus]|eukprot:KRX04547.1 hypothetical protein PPERSA_04362 [Pseudocohnilembus persalinus]